MTITEQARAAAEEIVGYCWTADQVEKVAEIITRRIHSPSLTEAIEEVKRFQNKYHEQCMNAQDSRRSLYRSGKEDAATEIIEALSALQGKAK